MLEGALDAPVFAERVAIAKNATVTEAFVAVSLACLRQIAGNHGAVRHGDPEGIHQMRIGLRRLRASLSLFKKILHDGKVTKLKRELKWLTGQLGQAREYDVFVRKALVSYRAEARRIRKINKRLRKLKQLDGRKRHKLRIAAKKVRYGREFFRTLRTGG